MLYSFELRVRRWGADEDSNLGSGLRRTWLIPLADPRLFLRNESAARREVNAERPGNLGGTVVVRYFEGLTAFESRSHYFELYHRQRNLSRKLVGPEGIEPSSRRLKGGSLAS